MAAHSTPYFVKISIVGAVVVFVLIMIISIIIIIIILFVADSKKIL